MTIDKNTSTINRVSFRTLGCKLNQAETDAIAALFRQRGWQVVPFRSRRSRRDPFPGDPCGQAADLTFINTCTVTAEADAKSRQAIRQAVQASPRGRVVATGCYAQVKPEEVAALEGVDLVLGTREKYRILDLLDLLEGDKPDKPLRRSFGLAQDMAQGRPLVLVGDTGDIKTYEEAPFISATGPSGPSVRMPDRSGGRASRRTGRARAFLKVQEGCDYKCSYCIIPAARGLGRSRPMESCLEEARRLVDKGYCEIVLTGVNIGTWQEKGLSFNDLLAALSEVEGLRRIRISSIEPNLITDGIIRLLARRENIAPHFHVPLQHASDRVLKAMRRSYRIADYRAVIERIAAAIPDAAIGADVMVGFPGETEDDFRQLVEALTALPLTYHHVFRYSEREGTVASRMTAAVDPAVRKERSCVLREISRKRRLEVARRSIGQTRIVHFEHPNGDGHWEGLTDNYLRVRVPITATLDDPFQPVRLTRYNDSTLFGRLSRPVRISTGAS